MNLLKNSWQLWQADVRIGKRWISFITVWKRWINWIKETKNYKAGQEVKENKFETFQIGLVSRICKIERKKNVSIDSFAPLFFLYSFFEQRRIQNLLKRLICEFLLSKLSAKIISMSFQKGFWTHMTVKSLLPSLEQTKKKVKGFFWII